MSLQPRSLPAKSISFTIGFLSLGSERFGSGPSLSIMGQLLKPCRSFSGYISSELHSGPPLVRAPASATAILPRSLDIGALRRRGNFPRPSRHSTKFEVQFFC